VLAKQRTSQLVQEEMVMALVRSDPFRDVDRFMQQLWAGQNGVRSMTMPLDAYRKKDAFLIRVDLPGVSADTIDLTVEDNVLTINAKREAPSNTDGVEAVIAERPFGSFSRQVFLGTNLDTENIRAEYEAGVLTLSIPVAEQARARRIEVTARSDQQISP
jgi:HSP20 family protein